MFKCFPFLCVLTMSIVSVMVPHLRPSFNKWFEYSELLLLLLLEANFDQHRTMNNNHSNPQQSNKAL
jgi:hypothetical protein